MSQPRKIKPHPRWPGWTIENQTRNGVHVNVLRNQDGSVVEADCQCFGIVGRVHSTDTCKLYRKQIAA